jgi:hypothetical protein
LSVKKEKQGRKTMPAIRLTRKVGNIYAGIIGGLFFALTSCIFLSIYYPASPFDRMFVGGLLFGPAWVTGCLAAYYAPSKGKAWLRVGIPTLLFLAIDVYGLMGG